jgi:lia operon protein LiaG
LEKIKSVNLNENSENLTQTIDIGLKIAKNPFCKTYPTMKNLSVVNSARILSFCASALLLLSSCEGEIELVQTIDEDFTGIQRIDIESGFLEVNYEGKTGQTMVSLDGMLESSREGSYRVDYSVTGNTLLIKLDKKGRFGGGNHRGTINLSGPKNLDLNINSGSGKTQVSGIEFPNLDITSGSGRILVTNVKAPAIQLKAGSGAVEGYNLVGNVNVEVSSGQAEIDQMAGNLKIVASSGNVLVKRLTGKLNAELSSGNLDMATVTEIESLKVSSGNITGTAVGLGPKTNLVSSSGKISIQTPSNLRAFNYDIQAGSGKVTVGQSSSTGSIKIDNGALHTVKGSVSSGSLEIKN